MLRHRSGIRTVSTPMTQDDIICPQGQIDCTCIFPNMGYSYSSIVHLKANIAMLHSGDTCKLSNRPSTYVIRLRRSEQTAPFPSPTLT